MPFSTKRCAAVLAGFALAGVIGCGSNSGPGTGDPGTNNPNNPDSNGDEWSVLLGQRNLDYSAALRIAALRLTGDLPTLAEVKFVADAGDQRGAYEALVSQYIDDPRFTNQMISFWRDAFKISGSGLLDSAPLFAAQVTVEGRPYTDLLTASSGTCPSFDAGKGEFTAGDCNNSVPAHAGLLTHPGINQHFTSAMAFRRVRWVQETFACTAFPAEVTDAQDVGGAAAYTAPWPFESIAGYASGGAIDFLDVSAVACANCHATMNHLAPLFGHFDDNGTWSAEIQVVNPTDGQPVTLRSDWLPENEPTAWRLGQPVADLAELGSAMAADPAIAECAVARVWNWAFGKQDIVDALALVPAEVVQQQVSDFATGGYLLKSLVFDVFTNDDFVRF